MKRTSEWRGRRVGILGAARTGAQAAGVLARIGASVTLYDQKPADRLPGLAEICPASVMLALGSPDFAGALDADILVTSPGFPPSAPVLAAARRRGLPILPEIEVAWQLCEAPIIAVTGTNGKSTTTAWIADMLSCSGKQVHVGGNLAPGDPLIILAERAAAEDRVVAEVSSFQLEATVEFRPWIAVLTNLTPDHLDRHGSMDAYAAAKARLFTAQTADDWAVLNADSVSRSLADGASAGIAEFSRRKDVSIGACVVDGCLELRLPDRHPLCLVEEVGLSGTHNLENGLAAAAAAALAGACVEGIVASLRDFGGVPHRLETIAWIDNVRWVNNSMCTNPDALARSIESFAEPVILIAGGRNKGLDFAAAAPVVAGRARAILLIGESAPELAGVLSQAGRADSQVYTSLEAAVQAAAEAAQPGDTVVLAPGCASLDMFDDFMERGNRFRQAVARVALGRRDPQ